MAVDDQRYIEILYGFHPDDWTFSWGDIVDTHYLLDREFIDEACSSTDFSSATDDLVFIYPFYFKNIYFIEGVIKGQITYAAEGDDAHIDAYKITLYKVNIDITTTELATTGWVEVNDTLVWDDELSVGDEIVYPFWIDVWQKKDVFGKDRLYIKIETKCNNNTVLMHRVGTETIDLKIEIPIRG